jgi:hypothetical protein
MTGPVKISTIIILLVLVISCHTQPKEVQTCNLTVILDSTFNKPLSENIYLVSGKDTLYAKGKNYRQVKNKLTIKLDSIPTKEYELILSDIFHKVQRQKLHLTHDTVISISNQHRYESVQRIPLADFEKADTIQFIYSRSGCSSHIESFMLVPKDSVCLLEPIRIQFGNRVLYNHYVPKTESKGIVKGLFDLQIKSIKHMKSMKNKENPWSTSRVEYYILVNNQLFKFDDENRCCEEYSKFRKKFLD